MKKIWRLFVSILGVVLLAACPVDSSDNGIGGIEPRTGKVTFFNESSYSATVHLDAFSGPVLIDSLGAGQSKKVDVRTSDNYGIGSTFCIEYLYRVVDGTDLASGEVWAKGIDPNVQINFVVEEDKSYTKQIPQPAGLEFPMAFIKILNASGMQFELTKRSTAYKQTGNQALSVPAGKTGVYQIESSAAGKAYDDFAVLSVFVSYPVPAFTAKDSYIYTFLYNGSAVQLTGSQKIVFN
jgi:hypothetical protein